MDRRFLFAVFLFIALLASAPVRAEIPLLKVVAPTKSGGFEAEWELPKGAVLREVIASISNEPDKFFGLKGWGYGWVVSGLSPDSLKEDQTRFNSPRLDPGTYYVRIGIHDPRIGPGVEWSNILEVKVMPPQFSEPADLYLGKTDQGEKILLRISKDEVQEITVRAHCGVYGWGEDDLYGPFLLGQAGFEARGEKKGYGGGVVLIVKGKFVDKYKVQGTIQVIADERMRNTRCSTETNWSAIFLKTPQ